MKKLIKFTPAAAAFVLSLVTLFIYLFAYETQETMRIIQICIVPLIALIIPLINRLFKMRIPFIFNVVITLHAVLALDFAAALGFYDKWPWFDKFLHANFGFLGGMGLFIFALYFGGRKLKPFGFFLLIFLAVMGLAALWEVWEFTVDCISVTSDCQAWKVEPGSLEAAMTVEEYFRTHNPLSDTLWDIIVTIFGCFVFFAAVFADKLCGYKVCRKVWAQIDGGEENKEKTSEKEDENKAA